MMIRRLIPILLLSLSAWGGIAEVGAGSQRATALGAVGSQSKAFPANVVGGNHLVAGGTGFLTGGAAAPTASGTGAGCGATTFTVLSWIPFTNGRSFVAYGTAAASGACTINITWSGSVGNSFSIDEFSGQHATPLDLDGGHTSATSITASDTITTITANDLIIGVAAYDAGTTTFVAGGCCTLIGKEASNAIQDHLLEFQIVTTAQLYTITATIGVSAANDMATVGFKEAAAGGAAPASASKMDRLQALEEN